LAKKKQTSVLTFGVSVKQNPIKGSENCKPKKYNLKIKLMKFIYIFILFSLISTCKSQTVAVSSGVKLMPVANIPNIYADAPAVLTEMQVNEQLSLEATAQSSRKRNDMIEQPTRQKVLNTTKNKTYPKI
jgi:hypothetical protein